MTTYHINLFTYFWIGFHNYFFFWLPKLFDVWLRWAPPRKKFWQIPKLRGTLLTTQKEKATQIRKPLHHLRGHLLAGTGVLKVHQCARREKEVLFRGEGKNIEGLLPLPSGAPYGRTWAIGYFPIACAMPTALLRPRLVSLRAT